MVLKTLQSIILVVILVSVTMVRSQDVVITVQGNLRGTPHDGYISYTGIPYATIKDNASRFKQAGLAPFWSGTREAPSPNCSPSSVEDCLQLDVHVPATGASPWPVLVWIRGGTGQYHPRKLVQQGVIVVIVSHRMGPVGFLCLNEVGIPGNAGAKDVVQALQWVRDNIVAFRGNPAKVIVAAQGFGAAILETVMLSPKAQGLYQGVILQSGTALSPSAFNYDADERAKGLADLLDEDYDGNPAEVLLSANTADLAGKAGKLNKSYYPFGLCVERVDKERLISEAPFDLLTSRKVHSVPMIIGYNSHEAYVFTSNIKEAQVLRRMSREATFLLPDDLKFFNGREKEQVSRQVWDVYFQNNLTMASILGYHSDAYFLNHIYRSVRLHASASTHPVYLYQFSHAGEVGVQQEPGVKKQGAAHSDELSYLFIGRDLAGDDGNVQQKLVKLWTNFAKYLTPTPKVGDSSTWDPVDVQNPRLLNIGTELRMEPFPHTSRLQLWDDIYEKFYYSRYRNNF